MNKFRISFGVLHTIEVDALDHFQARSFYDEWARKNPGWYKHPLRIDDITPGQLEFPFGGTPAAGRVTQEKADEEGMERQVA